MFEELEAQRGEQAKRLAAGLIANYGDSLGNTTGVYQGASVSLGTGFEYDDDGNVVEPEGGYWSLNTPMGSAPLRP